MNKADLEKIVVEGKKMPAGYDGISFVLYPPITPADVEKAFAMILELSPSESPFEKSPGLCFL